MIERYVTRCRDRSLSSTPRTHLVIQVVPRIYGHAVLQHVDGVFGLLVRRCALAGLDDDVRHSVTCSAMDTGTHVVEGDGKERALSCMDDCQGNDDVASRASPVGHPPTAGALPGSRLRMRSASSTWACMGAIAVAEQVAGEVDDGGKVACGTGAGVQLHYRETLPRSRCEQQSTPTCLAL